MYIRLSIFIISFKNEANLFIFNLFFVFNG